MSELALTWESICGQYAQHELQESLTFIENHVDSLVMAFYQQMIQEKAASEFFSDDIIQKRLKDTLRAWLIETFSVAFNGEFEAAIEKQQKVGRVHARVGIPSWLIIRGVREIHHCIFKLQKQKFPQSFDQINSYIVQIMSFSTEVMCRSYEENVVKNQEVKHSYRMFSAMQDVAVQKDHQRSSLLDWENELMYKVFSGQVGFQHPALSKSEFGLWFIHKASYAFSGSDQAQLIVDRIYEVDRIKEVLLNNQEKKIVLDQIQAIRHLNREIQNLIEQLFQVVQYIEAGNDALTQLLNRRYLNTIVGREINFARKNNVPLSLLAIDADFFKKINDQYGHAVGDLALKFIGETLQHYSRGSDYAFRIGGEEFLLLLVDTGLIQAKIVAENIRQAIEAGQIAAAQGQPLKLTVSIGCVEYDGHPDYQKFLDIADEALYLAKNGGRNQVYTPLLSIKRVSS